AATTSSIPDETAADADATRGRWTVATAKAAKTIATIKMVSAFSMFGFLRRIQVRGFLRTWPLPSHRRGPFLVLGSGRGGGRLLGGLGAHPVVVLCLASSTTRGQFSTSASLLRTAGVAER